MYWSWSTCIKHVVSKLWCVECYNLYYKYVNNNGKLKSLVLTANGEEPNPYATLTATSMLSTSIDGLYEYGVSWDTNCIFVHINV